MKKKYFLLRPLSKIDQCGKIFEIKKKKECMLHRFGLFSLATFHFHWTEKKSGPENTNLVRYLQTKSKHHSFIHSFIHLFIHFFSAGILVLFGEFCDPATITIIIDHKKKFYFETTKKYYFFGPKFSAKLKLMECHRFVRGPKIFLVTNLSTECNSILLHHNFDNLLPHSDNF